MKQFRYRGLACFGKQNYWMRADNPAKIRRSNAQNDFFRGIVKNSSERNDIRYRRKQQMGLKDTQYRQHAPLSLPARERRTQDDTRQYFKY